jgi:ribosome-associated toxin RatA of RatAB toxin-antitoxin module
MLRRHLFCWMLLAATLCPVQWAMSADGPPLVSGSDVRVERIGGGFTVDLTLYAPVAPSRAWEVLTDFDRMSEFVPNLKSSSVSERNENVLKVNQKGVARYGIFFVNFESVQETHLSPQREIRANGVSGDFHRMDSVMRLQAEGAGTRLTYHADVLPNFWFPPFIGPTLVRHEIAEQFTGMLREMTQRK